MTVSREGSRGVGSDLRSLGLKKADLEVVMEVSDLSPSRAIQVLTSLGITGREIDFARGRPVMRDTHGLRPRLSRRAAALHVLRGRLPV